MKQKPDNVREFVWKFIDTDIALKKDLDRDIINVRSLASYILATQKLNTSLDAIISAIRRYEKSPEKRQESFSVHEVLKQARPSIRTKMASLLLKRTDFVKSKLGRPDKIIAFQEHDAVRILEGSQALTLVIDQKNLEKVKEQFPRELILEENRKVGMIEVTNGLAESNISIIDALISSNEHILLVEEENLLKAFELIYNLCSV
jgi:DNA polymerase III delta prime subunit